LAKYLPKLGLLVFMLIIGCSTFGGCASQQTPSTSVTAQTSAQLNAKISSLLAMQVDLRKAQLANPAPERLLQMQQLNMDTANLGNQRIYIYLKNPPTPAQTNEMQTLNVAVYSDSWIPPAGNNPAGFILAELPIDKLDELASLPYVVSIDTSETSSSPQFHQDNSPGNLQ
jgi:hypothetical protein